MHWHHLIRIGGQNQIDSPVSQHRELSQTPLTSDTCKAACCPLRKQNVIVQTIIIMTYGDSVVFHALKDRSQISSRAGRRRHNKQRQKLLFSLRTVTTDKGDDYFTDQYMYG